MNEPCSKECSEFMYCDFCTRYDSDIELCKHQNKPMLPYEECDCDMFRCFTLDKKVEEEI